MKKSGRMIVTVCAVASGIWGIPHVAAFQDALGDEAAPAIDNQDAERSPEVVTVPAATASNNTRQTDPPLTWRIDEGFLYITTRILADEAAESLILRSYDISGLRAISTLIVPGSED